MNRRLFISLLTTALLFTFPQFMFSQSDFELESPLDIPIILSGNFGEVRSNHFHAGIDIKTQGREGLKVYAVKEGYVSRIKVSTYGYGKVLYITHPNGLTSVYGHLKQFTGVIADYVITAQYKQESFEIELFPAINELQIEAGEFIAYSGNTGGSGGPHLHFELRSDDGQLPVNPSFKGFYGLDHRPPILQNLFIYEFNQSDGRISNCIPVKQSVSFIRGNYLIDDTLTVSTPFALGIEAHDLADQSENWLGIYNITLIVNGKIIYHRNMESLNFSETRYANAHIDYAYKIQNGKRITRLFKLPNDQLGIYKIIHDDGLISNISTTNINKAEILLRDDKDNSSNLTFYFNAAPGSRHDLHTVEPVPGRKKFLAKSDNQFVTSELILRVPANALYEDLDFTYKRSEGNTDEFGSVHTIHNDKIPLHISCQLGIKPGNLSASLYDKAILLKRNGKGWESAGGSYSTGLVRTSIRSFGSFKVGIDTVAPGIKPLFIDMSKAGSLSFKIWDSLSGVSGYRCTINDKWVLLEYEHKLNRLRGDIPVGFLSSKNIITLEVWDNKGNNAFWSGKYGK